MSYLYLDFETRSELDLPSVGAYKYAAHQSTRALCAAWATYEGPISLWTPEDEGRPLFADLLRTDRTILVAHNLEFEREILRHKFGVVVPLDRCLDTAALAARMSLPRKLEELAAFFGLEQAAKQEGKAAITALSKPRKDSSWWAPETKPEMFAKLYARCRKDVELTRKLHQTYLMPLDPQERKIWQVTIEMNERGIPVDLESIPLAKEVVRGEAEPLEAEFERLVGCKVRSYVRVAGALGLPDVRKPTVRKALRESIPARTRRALEIFQALSKSSVAKLDAMLDRHVEGVVRGSFLYCGAERTGRWSASGIQPQNFKRGLGAETEVAFRALHLGVLDEMYTGAVRPAPDPPLTPTGTISEMLRGFITCPMYVGDFSQIEARVLNWLAGEAEMLSLFAEKKDPYKKLASVIYNKPVEEITKDERFMGKQGVLGAGYGLGKHGFIRMLDETYDVQVEEPFAEKVINAYRRSSPNVVRFWDRLQRALVYVVADRKEKIRLWPVDDPHPQIFLGMHGEYAFIELPSGRRLYYARPEIEQTPRGPTVRYFGRDRYSKGWTMVRTYGGKIAENATQAVARDLLALAMLRLAVREFPLIMTVHDEVASKKHSTLANFKEIMEESPTWAEGLPLEVEVFETMRYRK